MNRPCAVALVGLLAGCSSQPGDDVAPKADAAATARESGHTSRGSLTASSHASAMASTGRDGGRDTSSRDDAGRHDAPRGGDAAADGRAPPCVGCAASAIAHLVLVVQENHTFDNYFGRYCTAPTGSAPSCNAGPACCEAGPATDPSGASPATLDDAANGSYDPDHLAACEAAEIDDGKMDMFVTGTPCSQPGNFAYAGASSVGIYWGFAADGAIADRYFQPVIGASSSNDMYLARAHFAFADDDLEAAALGATCQGGTQATLEGKTIADLLVAANVTFGVYAGGYAAAVAANPACAAATAECPAQTTGYPCDYDPGDIPFEYYASLRDDPRYMKDLGELPGDLSAGKLPAFTFVKGYGYRSEHPGYGDTITSGASFVQSVVDAVQGSSYAGSTLILVTWDESGGFFDHVAPPAASPADQEAYGPRIPLLAIGPFARKNWVSHVTMEHSSIVRFVEWNWLGEQTGQLGTRDAVVHNIGSMLDPMATGVAVPE